MKATRLLTAAVAALLGGASLAAGFDDSRVSLYYRLSFGGGASQPAAYGLSLDRSLQTGTDQPLRRHTLVDFRFQEGQLQTLRLNGVSLLVRDPRSNDLSIGGTEIGTGAALLLGGAIIGGTLCLTQNLICEDDDTPPPPPPANNNTTPPPA